jgi:outer membrane protein OmpA-like peptidoglycan-associated protein
MSSSLLTSILESLDPRKIGDLASRTGESAASLSRGAEPLTAALLSGMANKAGNPGIASQLFSLVSGASSEDTGKKLLSTVFGGNDSAVSGALGKAAGLNAGAVWPALSLIAPAVLSGVGRLVQQRGVSASAFSGLLANEGAAVKSLLPDVSGLFDGATAAPPPLIIDRVKEDETVTPLAMSAVREEKTGISPLLWLLPLLLIGGLAWWAFGRHKEEPVRTAEVAAPVATPAVPAEPAPAEPAPAAKVPVEAVAAKVPVETNVHKHGVENQLLSFIQNPLKKADGRTWLNFDGLLFDTDSAALRPESQERVAEIAAILKAHPDVHLKVGGYTDNTGDATHNLKLSQARAEGVVQSLAGLGVAADRLQAQGYGEQHPIASNATEESRALNRRIAISVSQK